MLATARRPLIATSATVLGLLVLLGAKAATAPAPALVVAGSGASTSASGARQRTVTGPVSMTPYGPVQVEITTAGGRLADVRALQLPSGGKSGDIAGYSAPVLRREALARQGANIDTVSGATYTSAGYRSSLQAALDQLSA